MRRTTVLPLLLAASLLATGLIVPSAAAATPVTAIVSTGPLSTVWIGNELSCQVRHVRDSAYELYPSGTVPGDCGTLLAVGSTLYAPNFNAHGVTATNALGAYTPFTPVSQSGVTGAGTLANPYSITTVVDVGSTNIRITQRDTYVVGDEFYHTDVTVQNLGSVSVSPRLYRAADCFLGGSDRGYGAYDPATGIVACTENAGNSPAGRVEEFIPRSPGSRAYHHSYSEIWRWIGTKAAFPNSCQCASNIDNGAGLSWDLSIPAGGSVTRSMDLRFEIPPQLPEVGARCTATSILVKETDLTGLVGDITVPFAESQVSVRPTTGTVAPWPAAPRPIPNAHATSDAREAGATYTRTTPTTLIVDASTVFSHCDASSVIIDQGIANSQAYGRAGVQDLTVRTCPGCAPIAHFEALDFEMLAEGQPGGSRAIYACDVEEIGAIGYTFSAYCHGKSLVLDDVTPIFSPPAEYGYTIGEALAPVAQPDGTWRYEGSLLHVWVETATTRVDLYVGHVVVDVFGGPATQANYIANGPCAPIAALPCG